MFGIYWENGLGMHVKMMIHMNEEGDLTRNEDKEYNEHG